MSSSTHITQSGWGWWDNAGRNLFWQLPQVTFININDEAERQESVLNETFTQAVNEKPTQLSERIINTLISNLSRVGKFKHHEQGACPTVELSGTVIVEIKGDPKSFRNALIKYLQDDNRFSTYSKIRPLESCPN